MSNLVPELNYLRTDIIEMTELVQFQLEKCKVATLEYNLDFTQEIIDNDKRVNGTELHNDKNCESILALYNPVAIDLRFVMASFKINSDLERIGDNAEGIAKYIQHLKGPLSKDLLNLFEIEKVFNCGISMLSDVLKAYEEEDTQLAREVFKKDSYLNDQNRNAPNRIAEMVKKNSADIEELLTILSIIRKLERTGDHCKNIAEEIIFYVEAKVLKHKKLKSKK